MNDDDKIVLTIPKSAAFDLREALSTFEGEPFESIREQLKPKRAGHTPMWTLVDDAKGE